MNQKTILYTSISVVALFLAYLMFSGSDKESDPDKGKESTTSQVGNNSYSDPRSALESELNDKSLFDSGSGFLDFSGVEPEEEKSAEKSDYYDPAGISKEERERRRKLVIEKYSQLAKQFPNNRYIPRKYSPEEEEENKRRSANMNYLQERILSNDELTPNEQAYFFENKKQESVEKLEILEYSMKKLTEANALPEKSRKLVEDRIRSIQGRMEVYDKELNSAVQEGGDPKNFE